METNEVMTNEVMDATEEVIMNDSVKTLKTLGMIGGALIAGGLAYKYAIKPIIKKYKDSKKVDEDIIDAEETDFSEVSDSEEE